MFYLKITEGKAPHAVILEASFVVERDGRIAKNRDGAIGGYHLAPPGDVPVLEWPRDHRLLGWLVPPRPVPSESAFEAKIAGIMEDGIAKIVALQAGKPLTKPGSANEADARQPKTLRASELALELINDLDGRSGFDLDEEVRGWLMDEWAEIAQRHMIE